MRLLRLLIRGVLAMRDVVTSVVEVVGGVLIVAGVVAFSVPAGLVAAGVLCIAFSVAAAR